MIAALVALALVAAGLGVTAAAIGIRLAGVRSEIAGLTKELAEEGAEADKWHLEAITAQGEIHELRQRHAKLEERREAELDELAEAAARCSDPAEIRRQLQKLTSPRAT